jgi:hypothetical protein
LEINMPINGELTFDYRAYRRMALPPAGVGTWMLRGLAAIIAVLGVLVMMSQGFGQISILVVVAVALCFGPELLVLLGWLQMRQLTNRPFRYEVTATTIRVHTAETDASVRWDGISKIRTRPHAWLFTVAISGRAIPVPRAAFTAEAQQELDRFISARAGGGAAKQESLAELPPL